jgi:hypothetical protein
MLIAMPVAAWVMYGWWLRGFTYRIGAEWWVFVVAGLMVMVVTLATVSIQAVRTAMLNPVKNLRTE